MRGVTGAALAGAVCACAPQPVADDRLAVLSPTGVGGLLAPIIEAWGAHAGVPVLIVEDTPERIARQVNGGARADLFISAEPSWLDELAQDDHLADGARAPLFVDPLVIATRTQPARPVHAPADLTQPSPLRVALAQRGWEGRAGAAALRGAGAWEALEGQLLQVDDGPTAVRSVVAGDVDAALVRRTAALSGAAALTATRWPASDGLEVQVEAAVLRGAPHGEAADALAAHLCESAEARAALDALGLHRAGPRPAAQGSGGPTRASPASAEPRAP